MNSNSENSSPHEREGDQVSWEKRIYYWFSIEEKNRVGEDSSVMTDIFNAALKARRNNLPIHLLIFVIKDKVYSVGSHIYILDLASKVEKYIGLSDTKPEEALKEYSRLMEELKAHKLSKGDVAKSGGYLFKKLIPDVISGRLQNKLAEGPDKVEWGVWIYSNDAEFNPLWEWLYTSPSNNTAPETSNVENYKTTDKKTHHSRKLSSHPSKLAYFKNKILQKSITMQQSIENNEEDGFFWGDNFFLVRVVPEECEIQEQSVFKIDKVAVLRQKSGCTYSSANATYIDNLCVKKSKEICDIVLEDLNALKTELVKKSDPVDYILHVAASKSHILSDKVLPALDILKGLNKKPLLLFLNICECDPTVRSEFINSIPTKTWIDTSSCVAMNNISSCKFAEFFYEEFFDNGKNVVVAATEARKGIRDRRDLDDSHKLWRLAYAVNGNPYIKIT
jgi:hypothetical protein